MLYIKQYLSINLFMCSLFHLYLPLANQNKINFMSKIMYFLILYGVGHEIEH